MSYQNPQILYFLFAISIPIFIHLFNLRKHKVVYFSNVTFLKEIQSEKKKKNTLKQLLILLSRILAISAIVFAFANPYIPNNSEDFSTNNTIIYVDNSFSMDNVSEKGRLLDLAKENALGILNASNANKFWILTNNFSETGENSKNKKEASEFISNIKLSSEIKNTNEILKKTKAICPEKNTLYIISDFQKFSTNLDEIHSLDSSQSVIFIPTLSKNTNISIDNCYLNSPINTKGNLDSISIIISNHSDEEIEISVNLKINKNPKIIPKDTFLLLANEKNKIVGLRFSPEKGINNGLISIEDNSITYDNKLYFSFNLDEKTNVCQISETENKSISRIFNLNKEEFNYKKYTDENSISYDYDLMILNQLNEFNNSTEIKSYIEKGGSVCIIPAENADIESYNSFLKKLKIDQFSKEVSVEINLDNINMKHDINKGVFDSDYKIEDNANLPTINNYYKLQKNSNDTKENVFSLENDDEFLNSYELGKGKIYLFNSPLSEGNNNFCNHPLFVTTLLNMAVNTPHLYYIINEKLKIKLPKNKNENKNDFYLKEKDKEIICEYRNEDNQSYLSTYNHIKDDGHYELLQEDQVLQTVSFNYDRSKESNTEQFTEKEISDYIKNIENVQLFDSDISINQNIENLYKNKGFWEVLILLSLLFITIEILLIKLIKS